MKAPIVLITNTCPFWGEAFLQNELRYIPQDQQVFLFPIHVGRAEPLPELNLPNVRVCVACPGVADRLLGLLHGMLAPFRNGELRRIFRKGAPVRNFAKAVKFSTRSDSRARAIYRRLKREGVSQPLFYSYWLYEAAYAAARVKRHYPGSVLVSRCHGYDLYAGRHPGGYLPYRPYLLGQMRLLCPISQDGVDYLSSHYPEYHAVRLSRLGTGDHGVCTAGRSQVTTVVSCSNLHPVKRVELLIQGLAQYDKPLRWIHFGDGERMEAVRYQVQSLPEHIRWELRGNVPNDELMAFYKTTYVDVFINVSSSEGVPVSIMEALSFGIPVVATDVGGTHEIVVDGYNGLLLPAQLAPRDIGQAIENVLAMDGLREQARTLWQERCDAAQHYGAFYEALAREATQ